MSIPLEVCLYGPHKDNKRLRLWIVLTGSIYGNQQLHWLPTECHINVTIANVTHSSLLSAFHAPRSTRTLRLSNTNLISTQFFWTSFGAATSFPPALRMCTYPDTSDRQRWRVFRLAVISITHRCIASGTSWTGCGHKQKCAVSHSFHEACWPYSILARKSHSAPVWAQSNILFCARRGGAYKPWPAGGVSPTAATALPAATVDERGSTSRSTQQAPFRHQVAAPSNANTFPRCRDAGEHLTACPSAHSASFPTRSLVAEFIMVDNRAVEVSIGRPVAATDRHLGAIITGANIAAAGKGNRGTWRNVFLAGHVSHRSDRIVQCTTTASPSRRLKSPMQSSSSWTAFTS